MPRRMVGYFTYYGASASKDKDIVLYQEVDDSLTLEVEGLPEFTKKNLSYGEGRELLETYKEMSLKDWGASEIYCTKRVGEYEG